MGDSRRRIGADCYDHLLQDSHDSDSKGARTRTAAAAGAGSTPLPAAVGPHVSAATGSTSTAGKAGAQTRGRPWRWRLRIRSSSSTVPESVRPTAGTGTSTSTTPSFLLRGSSSTTPGTATTCATTATGTTCTSPAAGGPLLEEIADELGEKEMVADEHGEQERVKQNLDYIKALVLKFVQQDNSNAPEIWLSELDVIWVLRVALAPEISGQLLHLTRNWILALFEITKSISVYFHHCNYKEDGHGPPPCEFIRFVEATLSKMLPFVDAVVADTKANKARWEAAEPADVKLQALLLLRDSLSTASDQILSTICLYFTQEEERRDLLSTELLMAKLDEAIWDTTEEAKIGVISSYWGTRTPSSDIHPITRSLISYIKVLWANYGSVNRILCYYAFLRANIGPLKENANHLTNLTIEIVGSLEEKLTTESQSFPDQSLKFLFLINNLHFVQQQLWHLGLPMPELSGKIDAYVSSYIQVSWAPVLKCLHNPTPHCFTRRSPLQMFESKFRKTFDAQKLWKVPDPKMRKMIREAIIQEVIPDYTEFLKDKTISAPTITPQVMKKMLEELFEG